MPNTKKLTQLEYYQHLLKVGVDKAEAKKVAERLYNEELRLPEQRELI